MRHGLTAIQLKIITAITVILGTIAWATPDVFTPIKPVLHFLGNLSLPFACFFVAEGYRHTTNLERYIVRMGYYWILSIYPYYIFFGREQLQRQNALFDLLLALLALGALEKKKLSIYLKIPIMLILFATSIFFGGWPIIAILLTLLFYYHDKWKNQMISITLSVIVTIICSCFIPMMGVPSCGNWVLGEKWYMLAFIFSIPIIKLYNGKMGAIPYTKFFFYLFYPAQFLVIRALLQNGQTELHQYYIYLHVVALFSMVSLAYHSIIAKPSKTQISNILMIMFAVFYMISYYIELTALNLEVAKMAIKIEYIGITGMLFGFTWFLDQFCQLGIRKILYVIEWVLGIVVLCCIFEMDSCKLFYQDICIHEFYNYSAVMVKPGIVYRIFFTFFTIVVVSIESACFRLIKKNKGVQRIRFQLIFLGVLCPTITANLKWSGLSKGYDIMTFGVLGFIFFFTIAMIEYGSIDGIQTDAEIDSLTGISNRSYFMNSVRFLLKKQSFGTMFILDMDNFKQVNDQLGHKAGDKVLAIMGKTLQETLDKRELSCRLGGDEFSVFLENEVQPEQIKEIAESVIVEFQKRLDEEQFEVKVGLSIGIATYTGNGEETLEGLYDKADKALYLAKNSGKGQYRFYQ